MKKLFLFIILLFIVAGCGTKEYDAFMASGTAALKEEKYDEALEAFKKAAEAKETEESQHSVKFTGYMADGLEMFSKAEFSDAVKAAEKITQADDTDPLIQLLKPKALKLKENSLAMEEELKHATDELAKGKQLLEEKNYDAALNVFKAISERELDHPKLKEISKEASDLMAETTWQKEALLAEQQAAEAARIAEEKAKAAALAQQRAEVFSFLKAASAKQHHYDKTFSSREAAINYFSTHFTREHSAFFVDEMYMEFEGIWQVIATDFFVGYVPDFSYNDKTNVEVNGNTITVSESVPANHEGPVTWDAHTERVTIQKNGNGMIITKIDDY